MKPNELHLLRATSDPRVSPDGSTVAYVVSAPNVESDVYDKTLWLYDGDNNQLTDGATDTRPRWSPDGTRLAFLRANGKEKAQVGVVDVEDGNVSIVTDFEFGVKSVEWAPDGSRLAVVATTPTEEWAELDAEERKRRPHRITRIPYRADTVGAIDDRRRHVWIVDPDGNDEPTCVTPGGYDETEPAWSPDGSKLAFLTDREPQPGLVSGNDVFEIELATGAVTSAVPRGTWTAVSYRADGVLHLLGNTQPEYPTNSYLYRLEESGSLTCLTESTDRSSVSLAAGEARIVWDGDQAVVGLEDSGKFGVISVTPAGDITVLLDGEEVTTGYDISSSGLVHTTSRWDSPGELYVGGEPVTKAGPDHNWIQPTHIRVEGNGGPIDAWILVPEGDDKIPLLLNVHGGPASQYGFGLFDEFQVYAAAGYGVVACNPRGSSGRGTDWIEAVKGDGWGTVDVDDIRAVVDRAISAEPRLDASRMGVMGGSYGGFMTSWLIGHEDRWKSAVVERALAVWNSFSGTSDIGGVFPENYLGQTYPNNWELMWQKSPLSIVHDVHTPTLIVHAEEDWRCPIEQAEQYFTALLRNGTDTELVRFPNEGHEMSRSGSPMHRQERFEAILDWHDRYLK